MAEKHILLTGYSTVSARLVSNRSNGNHDSAKKCMVNNKNAAWEIQEIPSEFEGLHLNSAYTTSETVFKELIVPNHKRKIRDVSVAKPMQSYDVVAVFAFSTNTVETATLENVYFHTGEPIPKINKKGTLSVPTHYDFITSRFQAIYEVATGKKEELYFDEVIISDQDANAAKSIDSVLKMVNMIESYIQGFPEDSFTIHVDMSGGFRHIPLILMMVLNILQRTNHKIGDIFYTMLLGTAVKVERINDIFDMQRFTNGIHEFTEFGSGEELDEFYKSNKAKTELEDSNQEYSHRINAFIHAVNSFSEAITLSDRNEFRRAVKGIESAWRSLKSDFSESDSHQDEEKSQSKTPTAIENNLGLLKTFLPRVEKEYKQLWETDDDLDYILWCLQHNFIQQALTLYSEIFPEVVLSGLHPIIRLQPGFHKKLRKKFNDKTYTFPFWVLNHYNWGQTTAAKTTQTATDQEKSTAESEEDERYVLPWSGERKQVDVEIEQVKEAAAPKIKEVLERVKKKGTCINHLRELIAADEDQKVIYHAFMQEMDSVAKEMQMVSLENAMIDVAEQTKLIVAFAKIFAFPKRIADILASIADDMARKQCEEHAKLEKPKQEKSLLVYVTNNNSALPDYYDRFVVASILDSQIRGNRTIETIIEDIRGCAQEYMIRGKYFSFSQMSNKSVYSIFMPHVYSPHVCAPYALSKWDDMTLVSKLYHRLAEGDIEIQTTAIEGEVLKTLQEHIHLYIDDASCTDWWTTVAPTSLEGQLEEVDEQGVSYRDLLVLRSLFIPYKLIKEIRNASVHARTDRDGLVTKKSLSTLLESSVVWLQTLKTMS